MSKKNKIITESENGALVPDDDFRYEQQLAAEEQQKRSSEEEQIQRIKEENKRREREKQKARDRKAAQDRLELIKLKNGIIEESEELKEVHEEKRVLTTKEKIANIWYHDKIFICFGLFIAVVLAFLIYDTVSKVRPDIEILMICDNNLRADVSKELLEKRIEKYVPDLNGDGKVKVTIMDCSLNDTSTNQLYVANSQKFFANIQRGEIIMVITDSATDPDYQALMVDNLAEEIPDNPYIDSNGLSLNMKFLSKEIKYEAMPNDIHICMRRPITTLNDSLEEMEENYQINLDIMKAMAEDLYSEAKACDDKGLKDPVNKNTPAQTASEADSTAESKTE